MVVLAASIITKSGKPLVSRQFMEMSRIRIEGLLAAFPKLVGTGKQHTFIETENIRYVFQPMEGLYLLLLTNKTSNILEDLDTLRLLSKVIPEYANPTEEDTVIKKAFEIMFAFDEVISMGRKENIQVAQIKQNVEMESMEEKLHKMIIQSKIDETKDHMRKVAKKLDQEKLEKAKAERAGGAVGITTGYTTSISSSAMDSGTTSQISSISGSGMEIDLKPRFSRPGTETAAAGKKGGGKKGMVLGKGGKGKSIIDSLIEEGETVETEIISNVQGSAKTKTSAFYGEPVSVSVLEKVNVNFNRDGGIENFTVNGVMTLEVFSEEATHLEIALRLGSKTDFNFKTHPNINKNAFNSDNKISLKDPEKPFPVGTSLGVLKWKWTSKDESKLPLVVNCWPSPSGNETYVNMDYEASDDFELKNVVISIPLSSSTSPTVNEVNGDWRYDARKSTLEWIIDHIDKSNKTGALEFVVPAADTDDFFPVDISFNCSRLICEIEIESVSDLNSGTPIKYAESKALETGDYQAV